MIASESIPLKPAIKPHKYLMSLLIRLRMVLMQVRWLLKLLLLPALALWLLRPIILELAWSLRDLRRFQAIRFVLMDGFTIPVSVTSSPPAGVDDGVTFWTCNKCGKRRRQQRSKFYVDATGSRLGKLKKCIKCIRREFTQGRHKTTKPWVKSGGLGKGAGGAGGSGISVWAIPNHSLRMNGSDLQWAGRSHGAFCNYNESITNRDFNVPMLSSDSVPNLTKYSSDLRISNSNFLWTNRIPVLNVVPILLSNHLICTKEFKYPQCLFMSTFPTI